MGKVDGLGWFGLRLNIRGFSYNFMKCQILHHIPVEGLSFICHAFYIMRIGWRLLLELQPANPLSHWLLGLTPVPCDSLLIFF